MNQKTDIICCCQKDYPHDEHMKFKLMTENEFYLDKVLFPKDRKKGEVIQLSDIN